MALPFELMKNETVTAVFRRHPVYVISKVIASAVIMLVSIYVLFILDPDKGLIGSIFELIFACLGVLAALAIILFLYAYWHDTWIITNQRLVDSVRNNPFQHRVSVTNLGKVQEVSIAISGIIPTIFRFGDVRCKTAGTDSNFVFRGVPDPNKVMDIIQTNIEKYGRNTSL